uniref:Ribosomal RNA small subunit methyltransferase A n=1 Tax=Ignisphaera aggregans TaxID=334771 RepID=A0A7J3N0C9_9CREN
MVMDPLSLSKNELIKWIKHTLKYYGIKLKKKLSQVMLVDPKSYRKIFDTVASVNDARNNVVTEIGSGFGTLTASLARASNLYIIGIELDKRFAPILREVQESFINVDIVISDARLLLQSIRSIDMVVGNLPYHITSDLLTVIGKIDVRYALVTVQKDVADRLIAQPGTKNYGKISLFTQYLFDVELIEILPPNLFVPPPEVFSAIVLLKRKRTYKEYSYAESLVKCLFSFKRKNLLKSLKRCLKKNNICSTELSEKIWRKRVFQLAPEDIDILATLLKRTCLEKKE